MRPSCILSVVVISCIGFNAALGQSSPNNDSDWQTLQVEQIKLHYAQSHEQDAKEVSEFLPKALKQLKEHFRPSGLDQFVTGFSCDIYLHPEPTSRASESQAASLTGTKDGSLQTYYAEIHLLTPSAHSTVSKTHIGEAKDQNYFERLLVHEYAAPVLDRITRSKPKGWRLYSAPRWFYEGYEEYLALTCSNDHSRTVTLQKYKEFVRSDPQQVRNDFGIAVKNNYLGGAMLVAFMYEEYGSERVVAMLKGEHATFGEAAKKSLDVNLDSFFAAWSQWRAAVESPAE